MSATESGEWLTRKQAAIYLSSLGYTLSPKRLSNLATNNNAGGGPPFTRYLEKAVRYNRDDLKAWLESRSQRIA